MTRIVVFRLWQFEAFQCNYINLIRAITALGYLRLPDSFSSKLQSLQFPETPFPCDGMSDNQQDATPIAPREVECLEQGQHLAFLGLSSPLAIMNGLMRQLSEPCRRRLSFTSGLSPSQNRPFQIHFLSDPSHDQCRRLKSLAIQPYGIEKLASC